MKTCYYCGPTDEELRPYGPGGSTVCFPCATSDPEREKETAGRYNALSDAVDSVGIVSIGTEAGPQVFDLREL